jgi:hypothetical protein
MTRREDWVVRLTVAINARRELPYSYGINDCWCLVRDCVEAITGEVLLDDLRPAPGFIAAAKAMISRGWTSVEDIMNEVVGEPLTSSASRPGDVISYEEGGDLHLAVRIGEDSAVSPSASGLRIIEREQWLRAWKIG